MNISQPIPWIDDDEQDNWEQLQRENHERQEQPLDLKEDPLAASWASYHIWQKFPTRRWVSLDDVMVSEHDRTIAETTRRYYRDKVALQSLKQGKVSQFRQDLYDICNGGIIRQRHLGMIYRLPYFFVEDIEREKLQKDVLVQPEDDDLKPGYTVGKETRRIYKDRRIFRSRRHGEIMEYWFRDDHGHAVLWPIQYSNDLRLLVDSIFDRSRGYNLMHAYYRVAQDPRTNLRYWRILQAELVFND